MKNNKDFIGYIRENVFILDGATGSNLQALNLSRDEFGGKEGCNENLVFSKPDAVRQLHRSFLDVGCMGVETDTFGGSRMKLDEYGLGDQVQEINRRAAEIAKEMCEPYPEPRLVFGSIGPTGMLPSSTDPALGNISFDALADMFEEQAAALILGGVDVLTVETSQDILEAKAALIGCKRAAAQSTRTIPIMMHVTLDPHGRMLLGTDIGSALVTLEAMGTDVIGINCSTGPEEMRDSIRFLSKHSRIPISCLPNMGIPKNVEGIAVYPLDPEGFAEKTAEFVEKFGVAVCGGCCGSTPVHLEALVKRLKHVSLSKRKVSPLDAVSSAITYVTLQQEPPPLLVGERINAQGSRKMKQLLLADDLDSIAAMARSQSDKGAHALDVCVALNEVEGETERFLRLAKILSQQVSLPIMIDSTDSNVVNEAIKNYPGRVIVNSVNLENGEQRINEVGAAVRDYGAMVIALTIDESGMAKTCDTKIAVAKRIAGVLNAGFDVDATRIIFDPLTFTLATGEREYLNAAIETLDAIEEIKRAIPGSLTLLGVSNVSFGLKKAARAVLNSVFLYHSVKKGLDLAIVNPGELKPYAEIDETEQSLAEDLIFNRSHDALSILINHFEGIKSQKEAKKIVTFDNPAEEVHYKIVNRLPDDIEILLDRILETKPAVELINTVLLPAMKEVGDKFGSGELILPFVLQSAEVMKRAVSHVEQFLEKKTGHTKAKIILATVFGDVHDIGKNLVKTILTNNGYEVKDLGKQVPARKILEEAESFNADAVGLSALLVSTSKQMPIVAQEMNRAGIHIPILVGGAAVTRHFAHRSAKLEDGTLYPDGFFYAKDAFEGLAIMDQLSSTETHSEMIEKYKKETARGLEIQSARQAAPKKKTIEVQEAMPIIEPPKPPFWGLKEIHDADLDDIYACMDVDSLYRLSWGVRRMKKPEYEKIVQEKFEPLRMKLQQEAKEKGYLQPKAVYGYFPCRSDGETIIVFDPHDRERVVAKMHFPRQQKKKLLSLADYFRSDVLDLIPLQIVTMGPRASEIAGDFDKADEYSMSYFIHGLSVEAAEGYAEFLHRQIRAELGLGPDRGLRYSHGYPACPNLADNKTILELLEAERRIGIEVTEGFQYNPEQTTGALVVHHPSAEYFSV
jgi:5-methyltetrahydrofolate--homocysteine methyltransferase